jgi:hypothetical protein
LVEATGTPTAARLGAAADIELLRRYEPVVAYTEGEMFFPMGVEGYVKRCSLWRRSPGGPSEQLVPAGELCLDDLARYGREQIGSMLSLRFVQEPLDAAGLRKWMAQRPRFAAGGRLARVGLTARFVNAIFYVTLLLRGRVPGGTTGAAQQQYSELSAIEPAYVYHGRVLREQGYTVLNYQFFHAMNDWRSSFFGVNDHEADWEQVFVYLAPGAGGELLPSWVAFASHDFEGDDLRRRWDDPDLSKSGNHPVVYAGAGSHSSYFKPGEYIISVDLKPLRPLAKATELLARAWRDTLRQGDPKGLAKGVASLISVPFVDYARGDGLRLGPGTGHEWQPVLIDSDVPWVGDFPGLWGLDTQDVFAGELAPAGPMYNRNGSVRQTWFDPVGWAGMSKEPLPGAAEADLTTRIEGLRCEIAAVERDAASTAAQLPGLRLEVAALAGYGSKERLQKRREDELLRLEAELASLTETREELYVTLNACERHRERLRDGYVEPAQAHVKHRVEPVDPQYFRAGRLAELWAAGSTGLLLILAVGLIAAGLPEISALGIVVIGAVLVDSILRGKAVALMLSVTICLAVVTAVVLAITFFWQLSLALIAAIGVVILAENLRELRAR